MAIEIPSSEFEPNRNFDLCALLFLSESHTHLCLLTHPPILPIRWKKQWGQNSKAVAPASPSESSSSLRVVPMMGQEVGPASLVWGKAHLITLAPPACRNPAELHRQQKLIWALGSTPGAWVSQVVKEGRGHGFYYSNPASQPGELSGWATFPSLLITLHLSPLQTIFPSPPPALLVHDFPVPSSLHHQSLNAEFFCTYLLFFLSWGN